MLQIPNYGDERQRAWCAMCGNDAPETRDHVPAKIFLDDPLPDNLPVVGACHACNSTLSRDEEYTACLIECTVVGSAAPLDVRRAKVRKCLERSPQLVERLGLARKYIDGKTQFIPEMERVNNVVLKLARGHSLFELNEPHWDRPEQLTILPLISMTEKQRQNFENTPTGLLPWPEVGSRAMQRVIVGESSQTPWIEVQPSRYRYLAMVDSGVLIRIVFSEYLACEVHW